MIDGIVLSSGTGGNMGTARGLAIEPGDVVISLGTSGTAPPWATGRSRIQTVTSPGSAMPPAVSYRWRARSTWMLSGALEPPVWEATRTRLPPGSADSDRRVRDAYHYAQARMHS